MFLRSDNSHETFDIVDHSILKDACHLLVLSSVAHPKSLCGLVVGHRYAASEGLRFYS